MDRERDAYQRMRDNTRQSAQYAEVCDAPPTPRIKPNYLSAMVWTSVVAAVVCTIFMGLLLYVVNESKLEDRLEKAATQALSGLEFVIKQQSTEIQQLRAENKKIHEYLKLWTPINNRLPPGVEEKWKIKGYGFPTYELRSHSVREEAAQCFPFLE